MYTCLHAEIVLALPCLMSIHGPNNHDKPSSMAAVLPFYVRLKSLQWWVHCVAECHVIHQLREVLVRVLLTQQCGLLRSDADVHLQPAAAAAANHHPFSRCEYAD